MNEHRANISVAVVRRPGEEEEPQQLQVQVQDRNRNHAVLVHHVVPAEDDGKSPSLIESKKDSTEEKRECHDKTTVPKKREPKRPCQEEDLREAAIASLQFHGRCTTSLAAKLIRQEAAALNQRLGQIPQLNHQNKRPKTSHELHQQDELIHEDDVDDDATANLESEEEDMSMSSNSSNSKATLPSLSETNELWDRVHRNKRLAERLRNFEVAQKMLLSELKNNDD